MHLENEAWTRGRGGWHGPGDLLVFYAETAGGTRQTWAKHNPRPPGSLFFPQGPEKEMDAIQAKEEVKKAQEEDEDDMLMGRFSGRENSFKAFHRRNEF